jgi:hypothetical protein
MKRKCFTSMFVLLALLLAPVAFPQDVTLNALLKELTSLDYLAESPDPAYTCKQFSSYDQRSTDPAVLTDENWFANGDRGQHLRVETVNGKEEHVMMDTAGPGAIVRFWSANPDDAGIVRFYIDGATTPTLEAPLSQLLHGEHPLSPKPIGGMRGRGCNTFLPIPYAKHCRVTASKPSFYYHINYRSYEAGTTVESFSTEKALLLQAQIDAAAQALAAPDGTAAPPANTRTLEKSWNLNPKTLEQLNLATGAAAIRSLECAISAEDAELALRQCLLEITFDGQDTPSVLAPLGDFFGVAPGLHPYASLPTGLREDGTFYAHWVMPFQEMANITLRNTGDSVVTLKLAVSTEKRPWTENSLYFHAKWRQEYDIPTRPRRDWNFITAQGRGRYVGNMLHVTNPVIQWWGEGDEKIYVDSEAFPSHFGTGSEDYYGYAWCSNEVFTHAYHNQPRCDGPGNLGQTCVNRFHIIDNIPFTTAFRFDMEIWHWAECAVDYAAVTYWYADAEATDNFPPIAPETLIIPDYPGPRKVEGALEAEEMKVLSFSGGSHELQKNGPADWSNAAQLWWRDGVPGDTLELSFNAPEAGAFEIMGVFTIAQDYGIMDMAINGNLVRGPQDFYAPEVKATAEQSLGVHPIKAGENIFTVTITGSNVAANPKLHMFGLDYLLLKPVK